MGSIRKRSLHGRQEFDGKILRQTRRVAPVEFPVTNIHGISAKRFNEPALFPAFDKL
jgi:hypothetical protein